MPLFENIARLSQMDLIGRRVLLRADLNVPLSPYGAVLNDAPLRALLPTLRVLLAAQCKVVIAGHYASSEIFAEQNAPLCLAQRLSHLLGVQVGGLEGEFWKQISLVQKGRVAFAPDLSVYAEETANDEAWAFEIARCVDVYVNDAVRDSRNSWASVEALPRLLHNKAAGLLLAAELEALEAFVASPATPFTVVLGGSGVLRKARLLNALLFKANHLLLGGVVANTFLVAEGWDPGASAHEPEGVEAARQILATARARGINVQLPVDAVVAWRANNGTGLEYDVRAIDEVGAEEAVVDIAIQTCANYQEVLRRSASVLWNGPMGACVDENSRSGSFRIAQSATRTAENTLLVGDRTFEVASFLAFEQSFQYVSLGGDASLALLSGQVAPGIESLRQ